MLPDPGRYEERYRLTGAALGLVSALLALGLGLLWHTQPIGSQGDARVVGAERDRAEGHREHGWYHG
jgi:hypothetical protein